MDIQAEKITLVQLILQKEDLQVLQKVKAIFKKEQKDWWDELSQDQKELLEASLNEADEGKVDSFKDFIEPFLK